MNDDEFNGKRSAVDAGGTSVYDSYDAYFFFVNLVPTLAITSLIKPTRTLNI